MPDSRPTPTALRNADIAVPASETFRNELRLGLPARVLSRIVAFDVIGSTNTWVRGRSDLPADTVIVADQQTAGRGRLGRSWYSETGQSLLMTILKETERLGEYSGLLPLATAVAVAEAVERSYSIPKIDVKWPNDLCWRGRKFAGVLITTVSETRAAIGIGVNVGEMHFPPELAEGAATLATLARTPVSRCTLLARVVDRIDARVSDLESQAGMADVLTEYRKRLAGVGKRVSLRQIDGGSAVSGTLLGIREDGSVIIESADGVKAYMAGDLTSQAVET